MCDRTVKLVDAFRMAQEYRHGFRLGEIAAVRGLTIPAARKAIQRTGIRVRARKENG